MSLSKDVAATPQRVGRTEVASPAAAIARRHDPDRFFCALFAPPERREHVLTLIAFNHELARALDVAAGGRDYASMGGQVRFQFWRDAIDKRAAAHELGPAFTRLLDDPAADPTLLHAIIDARAAELDAADPHAWPDGLRAGPGNLARATGLILGLAPPQLDAATHAGIAFALGKILRHRPTLRALGRHPVPDRLTDEDLALAARPHLDAARLRLPRSLRAALLPATFARRDLARAGQPQDHPRGLADRLAVAAAAFSGRI